MAENDTQATNRFAWRLWYVSCILQPPGSDNISDGIDDAVTVYAWPNSMSLPVSIATPPNTTAVLSAADLQRVRALKLCSG